MPSGSTQQQAEIPSALPVGTRLDEFELLSVLGVGGFGIVYLAFDHALEREVALKEYMPASLAGRTETMQVSLRSQGDADSFLLGMKSFINEAKLLARFDHPALLKVHRFWQANGTAYMAMPVLRGHTLKELRGSMGAPPDEAWLRSLLESLLGAINTLHAQGVYHRDIAPDNIQVDDQGRPVLLDFGAARRVLVDRSQTLTAILKPSYAPIEQYAEAGSVRQGPWTDLYALGATLHYVLLGHPPAPATARTVHDEASELTVQRLPSCSDDFLRIIDWMLSPRPADRPQSVAEVLEALAGRLQAPPRRIPESHTQWDRTSVLPHGLGMSAPAPGVPLAPAGAGSTTTTDIMLDDDLPTRVVPYAARPAGPAEAGGSMVVPAMPPAAPEALRKLAEPGAVEPDPGPDHQPDAESGHESAAVCEPLPDAKSSASPGVGRGLPVAAPVEAEAAIPRSRSRRLLPMAVLLVVAVAGVAAAALLWPTGQNPGAQEASVLPPAASEPAALAPLVGPLAEPEGAASPASAGLPAGLPPVAESTVTTVVVPPTQGRPIEAPRQPVARPMSAPAAPALASEPVTSEPASARSPAGALDSVPPADAAARLDSQPAATAPQDAAQAAPQPAGPEASCVGGNLFTRLVCMERQCLRSENMAHPDCLAWRKDAKRE